MARTRYFSSIVVILLTLFFVVFCSCASVHGATREEINACAATLLQEYYPPEDHLNTGEWNILYGLSRYTYEDKDQLENIYAQADSVAENCATDREKIKAVHDWICLNIEYPENTDGYDGYPCNALGNPCTVFKEKKAVCYGYANLTQLMLQHLGIPCIIVRGNSSTHVWNAVYLSGKWVFTDNTWDENLTKNSDISYNYFLMSDEQYNGWYTTQYLENWSGDCCYDPLYVHPDKVYHAFRLDAKGGTCPSVIPFIEGKAFSNQKFFPVPVREGRTFSTWKDDMNITMYRYRENSYFSNDERLNGLTEDYVLTACYNRLAPEYSIPEGIRCVTGSRLRDVPLPAGFSWNKPDQEVGKPGERTFTATFTPEDLEEYYPISNVSISVTVERMTPEVTIPEGLSAEQGARLSDLELPEGFAWDEPDTILDSPGNAAFSATFTPEDTELYAPVTIRIPVKVIGEKEDPVDPEDPEVPVVPTDPDDPAAPAKDPAETSSENSAAPAEKTSGRSATSNASGKTLSASSFKLKKSSYTYSGRKIRPEVLAKGLTAGKDYTIRYSKNKNIGIGLVTLTGIGKYKGAVTLCFRITPKKAAFSKLKAQGSSIRYAIKKQKGKVKWQISVKMPGKKAWKNYTVKKRTGSLRILKKKGLYKVRVRAFRSVSGKKIYGKWSKVKKLAK